MAKPLLDSITIYDAALALVESQGTKEFSIRRLTDVLNCSPNTIYTQVGNRDSLVAGMLQHFFRRHALQLATDSSWQDQCRDWCYALHNVLVENPSVARLMTWRHRPVVVEYANQLMVVLLQADFEHDYALRVVRVLTHETISLSFAILAHTLDP